MMDCFKIAFYEIHKLAVIVFTIPVSSSPCERSFSCLRGIKSYLRNRMTNSRLNDLCFLSVERKIVIDIALKDMVNAFDAG